MNGITRREVDIDHETIEKPQLAALRGWGDAQKGSTEMEKTVTVEREGWF